MRNFITGVLILLFFSACSERRGKDLLSVGDMKEDIRYFFHLIRDIHPDPYQRYDSMTFVALEAKMIESCSVPMTKKDFGKRLMKIRKFLDGHVGIEFPSSDKRYYDFPYVEFREDKMLLGNDTLLPVKDSFDTFTALDIDSMVPWDLPAKLSNDGKNILLNSLLSPAFTRTRTYTAVLKTANGLRDTIIPVETNRKKQNPVYDKPYSSAFYPENSMAVLYYNSCMMMYDEESARQYESFVNSFFKELESKGIRILFIDVTHNSGGNDRCNGVIINHLKTDGYTSKVKMTGKEPGVKAFLDSDLIKQFFSNNKAGADEWMQSFGYPIMKSGVGYQEETVPRNDSGYDGKVFVITSNETYSAAASFCIAIKQSNAGILVGEIAGQHYPICGNVFSGNLPNSKLTYRMPTTQTIYEPATLFKDGYICPDIPYPLKEEMGREDYREILTLSSAYTPSATSL